jgi:hypothetical protein
MNIPFVQLPVRPISQHIKLAIKEDGNSFCGVTQILLFCKKKNSKTFWINSYKLNIKQIFVRNVNSTIKDLCDYKMFVCLFYIYFLEMKRDELCL